MIAPGYFYTTNPPPNDGLYTITNHTGEWANLYDTWLEIGDNSADPNGYMMVVNAEFEPGLFYDQVIDGLCENTLFEFSADVINMIRQEVADHLLPNVSFLIDDQELYSTGPIPQNETWQTFGFTFVTAPGQTSVRLSLRNNAPGGIGNDLALDNISFRACGPQAFILPETVANICLDGAPIPIEVTIIGDQYQTPVYQWQRSLDGGGTWNDISGANDSVYFHSDLPSGLYQYRFLLANAPANMSNNKCRVISSTKVVRVPPKFFLINDTICEGLTAVLGIREFNESGTYTDSLTSVIGCDSIVTLNLTVVPDPGLEIDYLSSDLFCHDSQDGSITVNQVINGTQPYQYFLNQEPLLDLSKDNLPGGTYILTASDHFGCEITETVEINVPDPFRIDLGRDITIPLGSEIEIQSNPNMPVQTFEWSIITDQICLQNCEGIRFFPVQDQVIGLIATTGNGCVDRDSIRIVIDRSVRMSFPNAFSPNGDGNNDFFNGFSDGRGILGIERLLIFNRWGGLIWQESNLPTDDPSRGWDGSGKDDTVPTGVYLFVAEVRLVDQSLVTMSGDVFLLR